MADRDGVGAAGVILAFVAGAAVGAVAALLLAPATGEETRAYLDRRAREGREKAEAAARQGREFLKQERERFAASVDRACGSGAAPEQDV